METRGEAHYINLPLFAAKLYDNLTNIKGINKSFEEIAGFVGNILGQGNILDVGTGPGRLLVEISRQAPQLKLFGRYISKSMIDLAKQNLTIVSDADLRVGNISLTDFQNDFFNCIVSTGSFYNWDNPVQGLNEIFRILKPGRSAFVFDTYQDYEKKTFQNCLEQNLKGYNFFRKTISKYFLRKQLRMAYSLNDYYRISEKTKFRDSYEVQPVILGNLPIYVKLELKKPYQ